MRPADDINKSIKKLRLKASARLDKRVHDDISKALAESEKIESAVPQPNIWRAIIKSPITKLAAAAVIIIAVLIGIHQITGSGVAWAQVVSNIGKVEAFAYRMKMSMKNMPGVPVGKTMNLEIDAWISKDIGMRMDSYTEKNLISQSYVLLPQGTVVSVIPEEKKYIRMTLTDGLFEEMQKDNGDPRKMVDEFM
ncbi:MAG: hypothetical protein ACYS32_07145, partial [Planctomycetota bacterium]